MAVPTRGRYFGDITWFSQRSTKASYGTVQKALRAHIRYIANPQRPDLVYSENLDMEYWTRKAEEEVSKRWDSRVAGKVIMALPNQMKLEDGVRLIKEFFQKEVGTSELGIAIHDSVGVVSGERNLHAHIVFSARGPDGKKLRLNPRKLGELQRKWDEYLSRNGYTPEKCPIPMRKKIRPYHVRPDSAIYDPRAVEYLRTRRRVWVLIKEAVELEKMSQLGKALHELSEAEKEKRVSLQGEASPRRRPVSHRPAPSKSDEKTGATPSQRAESQEPLRKGNFLLEDRDG